MTYVLLAVMLAEAPIQPLAKEVQGGAAVTVDGEAITLEPGDCVVPAARCVSYVRQAEACFEAQEKPATSKGVTPWLVIVAAVLGVAAGMAAAQAIK
jgi:hypothetical protein